MQLFISYAHEDLTRVRELVDILAAGGHSVWFDDQILPGQDWKQELGQKINVSDAFVYAFTHSSVSSEWCQWEFATAVQRQKSIIPVLIESAITLPDSLKSLQYADFANGLHRSRPQNLSGRSIPFRRLRLLMHQQLLKNQRVFHRAPGKMPSTGPTRSCRPSISRKM